MLAPLLAALIAAALPGRVSVDVHRQSRTTGAGWAVLKLLDARGKPLPLAGAPLALKGLSGTRVGPLAVDADLRAARAWVQPAVVDNVRVTWIEALWEGSLAGGFKDEEPLDGPAIAALPARPSFAPAAAPPEPPAAPRLVFGAYDARAAEPPAGAGGDAPLARSVPAGLAAEPKPAPPAEPEVPLLDPPLIDVLGPPTALVAVAPPPSPWFPPQTAVRARLQLDAGRAARSAGSLLTVDAQSGDERTAFGLSASSGRPLRSGAPVSAQASLFGRRGLVSGDRFALAAGLDASLPGSSADSLALSPLRTRASVSAGLTAGEWTLTTSHALVAGTPSSALRPSGWDGSLAASLRLDGSLQAAAQLDALASWASDAGYRLAAAAAAGLVWRGSSGVGAGLSLRTGLGADGTALFGRLGLSASVAIATR